MTNEKQKNFSKEQWKFIIFSMIVYMFFYVTRKNLSMAQPEMLEEGVISTYALGTIITVHGVLYGLSRFVNGFWADRLNGRIFMAIGLAFSALMNFLFGCTSIAVLFAIFWIVNGWTQGMGFPACAKMLTHWIHPKELATKMSIWNTSHSFGAVIALGLCSLILGPLGLNWRWCFWVPAVLAAIAAVFCLFCVMDSPTEAGVPELQIEAAATHKPSSQITTADRRRLVFGNRVIWLVAIANFFVYIVRFGFLDWGPTFLKQFKGIPVSKGGLMIIAFELAAVVGTVFAGWVTDRVFKGRGVRTCVICMLCAALFSYGFWMLPNGGTELRYTYNDANQPKQEEVCEALKDFDKNIIVKYQPQENQMVIHTVYTNSSEDKKIGDFKDIDSFVTTKLQQKCAASNIAFQSRNEKASAPIWMATLLLMGAGFCIYGPQALIGIVAANQATKEAAAMANGFTGIMGYASTIVSGIGIAFIKEHYGWGITLGSIAGFALIGMMLFALAWNANATGYKTESKPEENELETEE